MMLGRLGTFYNLKIENNNCFFEKTGNLCLAPIRTLFGGRKAIHIDGCYIVPPKIKEGLFAKIAKIALSLIFFIPGIIMGTFLKAAALCSRKVRKSNDHFRILFNQATIANVIIEEDRKRKYHFLGDRGNFIPSLASYKKGYPWEYLQDTLKSPAAINLSGFKQYHVERFFKMRIDWNKVKSVDVSGCDILDEDIALITKCCPNIEILHLEGCDRLTAKNRAPLIEDQYPKMNTPMCFASYSVLKLSEF